jgi:hypothetical protein
LKLVRNPRSMLARGLAPAARYVYRFSAPPFLSSGGARSVTCEQSSRGRYKPCHYPNFCACGRALRSRSDLMTLAVRFNARSDGQSRSSSRQRRLNWQASLASLFQDHSAVANATGRTASLALCVKTRTAKVRSRYAARETLFSSRAKIWVMTIAINRWLLWSQSSPPTELRTGFS